MTESSTRCDPERRKTKPRNKSDHTDYSCNTTRNILEGFCCLLHLIKGKSRSGGFRLEHTRQAFGVCKCSAQL